MTYNLSPKTVDRWSETLDLLLDGKTIEMRSLDPFTLAYRLREALAAARKNVIEPYCKLNYEFLTRDNLVIARPKSSERTRCSQVTRRFESVSTELEVAKAAKNANEDILEFPNFNGSIRSVEVWCSTSDFSFITDPYLVLTRKEGEKDVEDD